MQLSAIPAPAPMPAPGGLPGEIPPVDASALQEPGFALLLEAGIGALAVAAALAPDAAGAQEAEAADATLSDPGAARADDSAVAMVLAAIGHPPQRAQAFPAVDATVHAESGTPGVTLAQAAAPSSNPVPEESRQLPEAAQRDTAAPLLETLEASAPASASPAGAATAARTGPARAAAPELRAAFGVPDWDADLGHALRWMALEKLGVAELRLNPPDLGPLEIRLVLGGEDGNTANVTFVSQHPAVREAIQNAMPQLREMLAGSGISLGEAGVNAESQRGGADQRGAAAEDTARGSDGARMQAAALPAAPLRAGAGAGLVDTFA